MPTPRLRIGQLLVDARLITAESLEEALAAQRSDGRRLGTLLVERGLINETQLTQILSHQLSVPWVSLLHIEFSRQLLNLVPREVADRFCLVPIYVRHVRNQGDTLYVAMDDPSNEDGLKACREHAGLPVRAMIAPPADIRSAIRVYYGVGPAVSAAPAAAVTLVSPVAPEPPAPAPVTPEVAPEAEPVAAAPPAPPPALEEPALPAVAMLEAPPARDPSGDGPVIEAVEIPLDLARAERLRGILEQPPTPPPPSSPEVENIPLPRGRAPRMVALTLLDGTTITLPAKRRPRERRPALTPPEDAPPSPRQAAVTSEPPGPDDSVQGLTARDLVLALRVVANGADASEVLGSNMRWEALFSALLSLMLKKHLIADWEFIDELKKQL
jgi:type IV pilus assembly protein PilB